MIHIPNLVATKYFRVRFAVNRSVNYSYFDTLVLAPLSNEEFHSHYQRQFTYPDSRSIKLPYLNYFAKVLALEIQSWMSNYPNPIYTFPPPWPNQEINSIYY